MVQNMVHGKPLNLIIKFASPLLIGNIFQQFYSMVDTIIVGRFLGVKSLAAVGSTGSMLFLIIGFVLGLCSGFSVLISQRFGANDEEGLKETPNKLIHIGQPIKLDEENLFINLNKIYEAAYNETDNMKELIKEIVPTYNPKQ